MASDDPQRPMPHWAIMLIGFLEIHREASVSERKKGRSTDEPAETRLQPADMTFNIDQLAILRRGLREAFRLPSVDEIAPPIEERMRFVIALMKLAKFLQATGIGDDVAQKFADMAGYLSGLESGIQHPVLTATAKAGRALDRLDVWMVRVTAVNGLECLIRGGLSVEAAARSAATKYTSLKLLLRPGDKIELKGSLISWRKKLLARSVSETVAQESFSSNYEFLKDTIEMMDAASRKAAGHKLLASAAAKADLLSFD
jgi:hypothetical protein